MSLGPAEVAKIAHLARLAIREQDVPAYARNLSAVSYTHLDVYKRQNIERDRPPYLIRHAHRLSIDSDDPPSS